MPKFVLIDPSILDYQGHHYEYAARVVRAAGRLGYESVVATNRKFHVAGERVRLRPVYRYGFWRHMTPGVPTASQRSRRPSWRVALLAALFGLLYSRPALWLARLVSRTGPIAEKHDRRGLRRRRLRLRDKLSRLCDAPRRFVKRWSAPHGLLAQYAWRRVKRWHFIRDTRHLLRLEPLGEQDIVFVPVVSEVELAALGRILPSQSGTWHLVFRHELPKGNAARNRGKQTDSLCKALRRLIQRTTANRVFFYTDTDELTAQYNALGAARFRTLPVPIDTDYVVHRGKPSAQRPLQIVYLGDARTEKGYHLLPALVGDLWERWLAPGRARFIIQSNASGAGDTAEIAIARAQLGGWSGDGVELLCEPLTPTAYRDVLLSADLVLLPYDAEQYRARSSGILAEALSAGVPVVVPAGTWLSRQLAQPHQVDFPDSAQRPPRGAIGAIFRTPEELTEATREVLRHIDHYRATALANASQWRDRHNPERLVATLAAANSETPRRAEPNGAPRPFFLRGSTTRVTNRTANP